MTKVGEQTELLSWLDTIPLSKSRKNIARDFSDGGQWSHCHQRMYGIALTTSSIIFICSLSVLMAELLKYFYPKMVELHNYTPANCFVHKLNNWDTLDRKVKILRGKEIKVIFRAPKTSLFSTVNFLFKGVGEARIEIKQECYWTNSLCCPRCNNTSFDVSEAKSCESPGKARGGSQTKKLQQSSTLLCSG